MKNTEEYKINTENISIVKFTTNVSTRDIIDVLLNKLTEQELKLIKLLTLELPMRSSMEDEDSYWDIVLVDDIIRLYLEDILKKYKIEYTVEDMTNLYYEKSKEFDSVFVKEINDFIDEILDLDTILDKINSKGIENLKKYELMFLERQSKK
jgi:hypothetical protein